jgi:hypothetical protein
MERRPRIESSNLRQLDESQGKVYGQDRVTITDRDWDLPCFLSDTADSTTLTPNAASWSSCLDLILG